MISTSRERGYATRAHTADTILQAWAPSREACLEEAARGFVASFADTDRATPGAPVEVPLRGESTELLHGLLEEIIYQLDTTDVVPAKVSVRPVDDGVVAVLRLVPAAEAEPVGAAPKAIAYSGLACERQETGQWRCQVTIDV